MSEADDGDVPAYSRGSRDERERILLGIEKLATRWERLAQARREQRAGPTPGLEFCIAELRAWAKRVRC